MRYCQFLSITLLAAAATATQAETFDIATATDLYTPAFRGDSAATYVAWDTFGAPGTLVINDTTPEIGVGSFVTTNGEDHQSGSLNYYAFNQAVSEDITFQTAGTNGSGYTTVIVQAVTLFGGFGPEIVFSAIDGVLPEVIQSTNAAAAGQLFAKYELPGTADPKTFSISSEVGHTSIGFFSVDTHWSPSGFADVTAIATPEPASALLAALATAGLGFRRR